MNQQLLVQTGKQRFNRKSGFLSGSSAKKFFMGLLLLFVGVNLLVIVIAKFVNLLGK